MYEDPAHLLSRLALGREEFCQRLLTTLIVGGTYPRWNSRSEPTQEGRAFLRGLDALSFGVPGEAAADIFVDELELAPLVEGRRGGAPDWAVLWPDRTWIIELKTEPGSHRPEQLPYYFELGAHHYPQTRVDITYLTRPLSKPAPLTVPGQRYAHVTWNQVVPLAEAAWGSAAPVERRYVEALVEVTGALDRPWSQQRMLMASVTAAPTAPPEFTSGDPVAAPTPLEGRPAISHLAALISATASDGRQRALDVGGGSLDDLLTLKEAAGAQIAATAVGAPERHVRPWIWRHASSGRPMTPGGAEVGYELRLSRYSAPLK